MSCSSSPTELGVSGQFSQKAASILVLDESLEVRFAHLESAMLEQGRIMRQLLDKLRSSSPSTSAITPSGSGQGQHPTHSGGVRNSISDELNSTARVSALGLHAPSLSVTAQRRFPTPTDPHNMSFALFHVTAFDPSFGLTSLRPSFRTNVKKSSMAAAAVPTKKVSDRSEFSFSSARTSRKERLTSSSFRAPEDSSSYSTENIKIVAFDWLYFVFMMIAVIVSLNSICEYNSREVPQVYEITLLGICQAFFAAWMASRLHVRFCLNGWIVVCERNTIREHYMAGWMRWKLDLFLTIPFEFVFLGWGSSLGFRILSMRHLLRFARAWTLTVSSDPLFPAREQFRLGYLFCIAIATIHGMSLFFLGNVAVSSNYSEALFYMVSIFTTVGYTDYEASTDKFIQAFGCVVMPLGCMVLGFTVAMVISYVATMDKLEAEMNMKRLRLSSILSHYGIPWEIQKDIIIHFSTNLDRENEKEMKEFLKSLPLDVSEKLELYLRVRLLRNMRAFASLGGEEHADALAAIGASLTPRYFGAGDCVFLKGDAGDELFIIRHGIVDVSIPSQVGKKKPDSVVAFIGSDTESTESDTEEEEIVIATLSDGQMFGEIAVIEDTPRRATVTAVTPCEMLVLGSASFRAIAAQFPAVETLVASFSNDRKKKLDESRPVSPS